MLLRRVKLSPWDTWDKLSKACKDCREPEIGSTLHRYYRVATSQSYDKAIEDAFELGLHAEHRDILVAYFLSRAPLAHITKVTEIPPDVLGHFRELFANLDVVRNKLEHRTWAEKYYNEKAGSDSGAALVRGGIIYGPRFLDSHIQLGIEIPCIDPKEFAERMIHQAFYMATLSIGSDPTSVAAKESLKWYKAATGLLTAYSNMDTSNSARQEALVAIQERRNTITPDTLGINPSDIAN